MASRREDNVTEGQTALWLNQHTTGWNQSSIAEEVTVQSLSNMSGLVDPVQGSRQTTTSDQPQSPISKVGPHLYCTICQAQPFCCTEEHVLRQHYDDVHREKRKVWICVQPVASNAQAAWTPAEPLGDCKQCTEQKHYSVLYNAAAHLRRAHFGARKSDGSAKGEQRESGGAPPIEWLKENGWLAEITVLVNPTSRSQVQARPAAHLDTTTVVDDDYNGSTAANINTRRNETTPGPQYVPYVEAVSSRSTSGVISTSVPTTGLSLPSVVVERATEHSNNRIVCPVATCGRSVKDLRAHMLTHQIDRPDKCPVPSCEYHERGFARKYDKTRHILTHYKGKMVCGFCTSDGSETERTFNRADVFKRHLTAVHGAEQVRPGSKRRSPSVSGSASARSCSTCGVWFPDAQGFYEHLDDCVLRCVSGTQSTDLAATAQPDLNVLNEQHGRTESQPYQEALFSPATEFGPTSTASSKFVAHERSISEASNVDRASSNSIPYDPSSEDEPDTEEVPEHNMHNTAPVARIMTMALPENARIAKEAKECMQECASEFISFITTLEKCQQDKRKTISGEDIVSSMTSLGFENYGEALSIYLARYRETNPASGR
ncbi:hypothetical protein LTR15_001469 [Elasticomyces elasticus]|nr:hypothetical protein LTR15_001469 [Elasticomyces elasticus]